MSDPVTNVEIEDVLSSIRRLVSSETAGTGGAERAAPDGAESGQDSAADSETDGATDSAHHAASDQTGNDNARPAPKLVLTPAQRVQDDAQPAPETPQDVSEDYGEEHTGTSDTGASDRVEAEPAAEPEAPLEDAESTAEAIDDGSDGASPTDAAETKPHEVAPEAPKHAFSQMVVDKIASQVEEDATHEVQTQLWQLSDDDAALSPEQDALETDGPDTAAIDDIRADADALLFKDAAAEDVDFDLDDGPYVPEFLRRPVTQMNPPEDAEIIPDTADDAVQDTTVGDDPRDDAEPPAAEPAPETLTSKLETLEDAVAEQADDWEPDGGDAETLSKEEMEPLPWNDIEAEMADIPAQKAEADPYSEAEAAQAPPWYGEDTVIDEDALRDMVGEIVRQELQGALGERITRNVRKLVRREIARALMSQGLD